MSVRILRAGLHGGEEPIVLGNERSGMVVFSGCHLACSFCYTPETSVHHLGNDYSTDGFTELLARLLVSGARNLSLISPSHVWSKIESVLLKFKQGEGRHIPLVAKISGYESVSLVQRVAQVADVVVPDFKVWGSEAATAVALPSRYGSITQKAVSSFMATHGSPVMEHGRLTHGMIIRHLLMPGFQQDSVRVIDALRDVGFQGYLNLMTCFISPEKGLVQAPVEQVEELVVLAKKAGMRVLVGGKG